MAVSDTSESSFMVILHNHWKPSRLSKAKHCIVRTKSSLFALTIQAFFGGSF